MYDEGIICLGLIFLLLCCICLDFLLQIILSLFHRSLTFKVIALSIVVLFPIIYGAYNSENLLLVVAVGILPVVIYFFYTKHIEISRKTLPLAAVSLTVGVIMVCVSCYCYKNWKDKTRTEVYKNRTEAAQKQLKENESKYPLIPSGVEVADLNSLPEGDVMNPEIEWNFVENAQKDHFFPYEDADSIKAKGEGYLFYNPRLYDYRKDMLDSNACFEERRLCKVAFREGVTGYITKLYKTGKVDGDGNQVNLSEKELYGYFVRLVKEKDLVYNFVPLQIVSCYNSDEEGRDSEQICDTIRSQIKGDGTLFWQCAMDTLVVSLDIEFGEDNSLRKIKDSRVLR